MVLSGIAVSEILLLKRLGFRVAVFSLPRRGHTFVTKMTSDWTHIGLFWQTPITFTLKKHICSNQQVQQRALTVFFLLAYL